MPHSETFIDGKWYPSVTTVMAVEPKPWLQTWHEKWGSLAERKTKLSGVIGDEFHRCVEQYLDTGTFSLSDGVNGFPTSCSARIVGMMQSFVKWTQSIEGVVDATELKVISSTYTYSGTLDAVGRLWGKPIIFDWKTSSRIYDSMGMQLAAYAQAYKEQTGKEIKEGIIVHVSKDKPHFKLTTKTFKLGKRVLGKFLKLRAMFDDIQENQNG